MADKTTFTILCDHEGCLEAYVVDEPLPTRTLARVKRMAREVGWYCGRPSANDRRDLCPAHAKLWGCGPWTGA